MLSIQKDGTKLAYTDEGSSTTVAPMVLVHGWGCDHTSLQMQGEHFRSARRVVSVDLRGHGESDGPAGDYTMASYAADIAWLCNALDLQKPIMVGHSMGGNIVLELATRYPETAGSSVLIDSVLFPSQEVVERSISLIAALDGPDFAAAYQVVSADSICLPMRSPPMIRSSVPCRGRLNTYSPHPLPTN